MTDSWTYEDAFGDSHVVPRSPHHMAELPEPERVRYIAQADALSKEVERLREENAGLQGAVEIIERIMTMHWDMAACPCWVCRAGRDAGMRPRDKYLDYRGWAFVRVDMNRKSA